MKSDPKETCVTIQDVDRESIKHKKTERDDISWAAQEGRLLNPASNLDVPFCQMAQCNLPTKHESERKGLSSKKVLERRVRIFWNIYF